MNIGNQILNIRKENQLTQEEFGKLFHVTRQTVSNWENSAFCRVKCIYYKDFSKLELQNSSACFRVVPGTDTISSEEFAAKIEELGLSGYSRIEFVVADPATVYDLDIAKFSPFSLSGFTMSIDLTTVVLTEQLYRAYTILNHITYHK